MTEAFMHQIQLMLIAGLFLMQLATLYKFKGIYRKLRWVSNKTMSTSKILRNLGSKLGGSNSELSSAKKASIN